MKRGVLLFLLLSIQFLLGQEALIPLSKEVNHKALEKTEYGELSYSSGFRWVDLSCDVTITSPNISITDGDRLVYEEVGNGVGKFPKILNIGNRFVVGGFYKDSLSFMGGVFKSSQKFKAGYLAFSTLENDEPVLNRQYNFVSDKGDVEVKNIASYEEFSLVTMKFSENTYLNTTLLPQTNTGHDNYLVFQLYNQKGSSERTIILPNRTYISQFLYDDKAYMLNKQGENIIITCISFLNGTFTESILSDAVISPYNAKIVVTDDYVFCVYCKEYLGRVGLYVNRYSHLLQNEKVSKPILYGDKLRSFALRDADYSYKGNIGVLVNLTTELGLDKKSTMVKKDQLSSKLKAPIGNKDCMVVYLNPKLKSIGFERIFGLEERSNIHGNALSIQENKTMIYGARKFSFKAVGKVNSDYSIGINEVCEDLTKARGQGLTTEVYVGYKY